MDSDVPPVSLVAEVFWKEPNVFDVAGVVGLIVGIASIWLAKWDIDKRLEEAAGRASAAARDEVLRVARAVLQSGLTNAIRFLELSREAATGRQWRRAADLCGLAREQLARVLVQPNLDEISRVEIRDAAAALVGYLTALAGQTRAGAGELAPDVQRGLEDVILALHQADARLTGVRVD